MTVAEQAVESDEFRPPARYELRGELGRGAMGKVYRAFDRQRGTLVALKTLREDDPELIYRFQQEYRSLAEIVHPNLVRLEELISDGRQCFFTMELVEGCDLLQWVRGEERSELSAMTDPDAETGELSGSAVRSTAPVVQEQRLRSAFAQLATALEVLHAHGKVHCDIKPANVRVTPEGRVVVLDFGLVFDLATAASQEQLRGTVLYMAPEQAAGGPITPAVDWYALGVVLFEALTGRLPFEGAALKIMVDKQTNAPPTPRSFSPTVPDDLEQLTKSLLRFDPNLRPTGELVRGVLRPESLQKKAVLPASRTANSFVGRGRELRELTAAMERVRTTHSLQSVVVTGESGVGKSEVVRRFCERASAMHPGTVVLTGRCYDRELVPFRGIDGVIHSLTRELSKLKDVDAGVLLPRDTALLARVFPVLRRVRAVNVVPEPRAANQPIEQRSRVFGALRELLTRLAEAHPVVMVLDDLQWANQDTELLLREVFAEPEAPALLLLATARSGSAYQPLPGANKELPLGPLDEDESQLLVRQLLGTTASDAEIPAVIAREGLGHPLFLQELSRHHVEGHSSAAVNQLDDALFARVETLEPDARRLLEVVCLAGVPLRLRTAAIAAELEQSSASRWSAMLRAGHLLRCASANDTELVEPYHDRVREAVLGHLDAEHCKTLHARLATSFESEQHSDPLLLVHHLEAAGQVLRAAEHAEHGAKRAMEALAFAQAVSLFQRAIALQGGGEKALPELREALGDALNYAGKPRQASEAYLQAAKGVARSKQLQLRGAAAVQALFSGAYKEGEEQVVSVLRDSGVHLPMSPVAQLLAILWYRTLTWMLGYRSKLREAGEISSQQLTLVDLYTHSSAAMALTNSTLAVELGVRGLYAALRAGEQERLALVLFTQACWRALDGSSAVARRLLDEAQRLRFKNEVQRKAFISIAEGYLAYSEGRFVEASAFLERGAELLFLLPDPFLHLRIARTMWLFAMLRIGEFLRVRRLFDAFTADARQRGDVHDEGALMRTCHTVWMVDDTLAQGRKALEQHRWQYAIANNHLQSWYELRALLEFDLYEGNIASLRERHKACDAFARSLIQNVQIVRLEFQWLRARVWLKCIEEGIEREATLPRVRSCARVLARKGPAYVRPWCELVRAALAVQENARERALEHLRHAAMHASACQMQPVVLAARWREGELLGGVLGDKLRTEAEESLRAMGIKVPARWIALLAPGFRSARGVALLEGKT